MRELERDLPASATVNRRGAPLPALAVIGRGRVGGSIAAGAAAAGLEVRLAGRDEVHDVCSAAEAALICVGDEAIAAAAEQAAAAVPPLRFVGHTSGATALDALEAPRSAGAETFSLHPLQTVPDPRTDFTACPCAIAGSSPAALSFARELAELLGMRPFTVEERDRAAYHAAASMASNFLVALEESAADLLTAAGVEHARELLAPLVLRTAANWAESGAAALTGPIARGDEATVQRHVEALRTRAPQLVELYEALAGRTREIAP